MNDKGPKGDRATSQRDIEGNVERSVTGSPFWLELEPEPIYGVLHTPREGARTRVAALILPPFGTDDEFSYRPRRDWATRLAESGVAAARIDFPGTEDSVGSPLAPGRFQSWVDATVQTAHWLREQTRCDRLVAVGIGLGGFVAYQAITANAPIDDLELWGVRATGRAHLRELRAFSSIVAGRIGDTPEDNVPPDGALWIAGHLMSAETAEALSAINLTQTPLPDAELRRVLLVGRDAHGVDDKLRANLAESGAALTVIEADDYYRLTAEPDWGWTPTKTISASIEWLRDSAGADLKPIRHVPAPRATQVSSSVEFEYDGVGIRERLSELQTSAGRLTGVISEPTGGARAPYCLVVVNAGALRHTGPSRMFVEIARRAAASGVPAARFDLPGIGDSDGARVRAFERRPEDDAGSLGVIREIYDHLERLGIADRFVGTGLCLGGYFTIRAILADERSIGAVSANPPALEWTAAHRKRGLRWFAAASNATDPAAAEPAEGAPLGPIRSMAHRAGLIRHAIEWRLGHRLMQLDILWRFEHRAAISAASKTLDRLNRSGASVVLLLGEDETALRILSLSKLAAKVERSPNIVVERLPTPDHNMRPLRIQKTMLERVSAVLDELGSAAEARATSYSADAAEEQIVQVGEG